MKKFVSLILLCWFLGNAVAAQQPGSSNTPSQAATSGAGQTAPDTKIISRVDLVNVLATVTDKKNHLVLNLNKDDLRVLENNQPQQISFFSRETDLPLRIGMLIDSSNSIRERLRFEQEAAVEFLSDAVRPGKDQAFVVGFDVEPQLLQDYTDDEDKLGAAIRNIQAGGGTGLYDAIFFACKQKMLIFPPPEPYLRRVMIIISDGQDNESEHTREEALSMAQRAEVTIFAISTSQGGSNAGTGPNSRGDKILTRLAQETGGRVFFPFEASDLAVSFQEIARELRSQYSVAYVSTNAAHDGTFRAITIEAKDKNLRVRAKAGYFAPTP
ncbi:MAG: VWA domain-containing protein [Terriglobia bacterium]